MYSEEAKTLERKVVKCSLCEKNILHDGTRGKKRHYFLSERLNSCAMWGAIKYKVNFRLWMSWIPAQFVYHGFKNQELKPDLALWLQGQDKQYWKQGHASHPTAQFGYQPWLPNVPLLQTASRYFWSPRVSGGKRCPAEHLVGWRPAVYQDFIPFQTWSLFHEKQQGICFVNCTSLQKLE